MTTVGGVLASALTGSDRLRAPMTLLRARRGMFDEPVGIYTDDHLATWAATLPNLRVHDVDGVNHYTIVVNPTGADAVSVAIRRAIAG